MPPFRSDLREWRQSLCRAADAEVVSWALGAQSKVRLERQLAQAMRPLARLLPGTPHRAGSSCW